MENNKNQHIGTIKDDSVELTPWKASGKFTNEKYKELIEKFGVEPITSDLLERFEKLTGQKLHRLLRRGLFFAHRHLNDILDAYEKGNPIYIYTGRGPTSDALHLGHIVPIEFTSWLQKVFGAIVIFQMADDEKYWFKDNMKFEKIYELGFKNARDIIALGFDPDKTFIFSNRDFSRNESYQEVAFEILKHSRMNDVKKIFGLEESGCVGQMMWPIYQTTASFSAAFGSIFNSKDVLCLVAYAIDQDPYFRLARDVAPKLGFPKPCSLMSQFLPSLEGDSKMSSSVGNTLSSTIFMTDDVKTIQKKINKYAFSGGRDTVEEHRKYGGNPDIDISYQWLRYFMEDDDELLSIENKYRKGELLSGELKKITGKVIIDIIKKHQEIKSKIDDDHVKKFYDINKFSK